MVLTFYYCSCSLPLSWVWAHLVLYKNFVTFLQLGQFLSMLRPGLVMQHVALGKGELPVLEELLPSVVRIILAREDRHAIPNLSAKHSQGW